MRHGGTIRCTIDLGDVGYQMSIIKLKLKVISFPGLRV